MSILIAQQIQDLQAQIAEATEEVAGLEGKLRAVDGELAGLHSQRAQYQLLDEICKPLEKLSRTGAAAELFRETTGKDPEMQLQLLRGVVAAFLQQISSIEKLRGVLQAEIKDKQSSLRLLRDQLTERQERAERIKNDPMHDMPYRVLPWSHHGGDERRFHQILFAIVSFTIAFGGLIPFLRQPVVESKGVVVPERIVKIIQKKQEAKKEEFRRLEKLAEKKQEAAKKAAEKSAEKKIGKPTEKIAAEPTEKIAVEPAEKIAAESTDKVVEGAPEKVTGTGAGLAGAIPSTAGPKRIETEAQGYRRSAESKGVLAFKGDLSNLLKDSPSSKMGVDAHISVNSRRTTGDALQRSIIVSQATESSGGIDTSTLNRQSTGDESKSITEVDVKFARVASPIPAAETKSVGSGAADRPMSSGGESSRTDEEIQIVFDRYKSALYRIYNRELRTNPSLRGRMTLKIVIEPDGRVSECTVKTNELTSPGFSADIVNRVLNFNFGPKEGAVAISILYPIEFLPAN